jgi:hypothetical protein
MKLIDDVTVQLYIWPGHMRMLNIEVFFRGSGFQLSSLSWVSTSPLPSLSTVERLYIYEEYM